MESRHPDGELPGRRRELEKFDQFLNSSGGVLLVTGPVGHGKSALVTTWRRKVEARRTHSVFHHYFDQSVERLQSAAIFYRRLLEHLLLEAEEQPPDKEQPSEQDVLVAWDRWKVANSKRQLVVVIDGLDETTSFALPLSNNLPKDVWFMVSCRSGEGSSLHPFAAALKKGAEDSGIRCQQFEVPPLDIPSLESWLRKSLSALDESLKANLPRMEDLAALVRDRSEGNALWVHFFIPDFCQALIDREQWQDVLKPERTPKGVTNLLLIQWQRLNDAAWTNPLMKLTLEILAYLIAARGSLTNQELLTLMGESPLRNLPNLPPEARRWVDVSSSDDKWGARFSLNHWLIRTAIAPKDSAFRREIDKRYAFCLLTYCRQHWSDGSPYALRHLPEELVKHRIWPELDTLVTNPEFQRRQREVFFDEPALALAAVRCALECEVASEPPDLQALTELSLTQASLVYQLAKPISQEDAANMSVLELAEHMTRLPVQWDPAARVMWHFLAAWLSHKERRTAERNTHLNALATIRDVQLPAAWGLLAGVILVETVSPFNPLLSLLAERFLSPEAKAEMLGRLTRRGNTGVRAARQWLRFCDYDEDTKFRSHVVSSLANVGRWKEADWEARAAVTIKGQAVLILQLAELAKDDLDCTERLGEWVEYLEAYVENADLSTGDFLRINTVLG